MKLPWKKEDKSTFDHKKSKSRADKYKLAIDVLKQR